MAAANPSYYQSPPFPQEIEQKEHLFHFYMFQHEENKPNTNQYIVVDPKRVNDFGTTAVNDYHIRDGPSVNAKIVARAQGVHVGESMGYSDWFFCFNIVFTDDRFKASSLKVLGSWGHNRDGEWAIIGGTGEFAFAQGTVKYADRAIPDAYRVELNIRALCFTFAETIPISKIGPWGGNGGTEFDIPAEPASQRLESVTIRSGDVICSIAFTYSDTKGKKQTVGPWGGKGALTSMIEFDAAEIVKEVSGTTGTFAGQNVVTSLTFITNVGTYGPFGKTNGIAFSVPLQDSNVVGFFVRAGTFVDAIGVYARKSASK